MRKILKRLLLGCLMVLFALGMVACKDAKPVTPEGLKLKNTELTWSEVEGLTYEVSVDGTTYVATEDNSVDLLDIVTSETVTTIYVRAKSGKSKSEPATYDIVVVRLAKPEKPTISNNEETHELQFVWEEVENADKYYYSVNGGKWISTSKTNFIPSMEGEYTLSVKARGYADKNTLYLESEASEVSDVLSFRVGPNLMNENVNCINWESETEFDSYNLWINGEKVRENVTSPMNLVTGEDPVVTRTGEYDIQIEAIKDGQSAWSNIFKEWGTTNINEGEIFSFDNRQLRLTKHYAGAQISNEQFHGDSGYSLKLYDVPQLNFIQYAADGINAVDYRNVTQISYWIYIEPIDGYEEDYVPAVCLPAAKYDYYASYFSPIDAPIGEWTKITIPCYNSYDAVFLLSFNHMYGENWPDGIARPYTMYIDDITYDVISEVPAPATGYDYRLDFIGSKGEYHHPLMTAIDFGAEYANKTIEFSMEVCGTAPAEGEALLGFTNSDSTWYQLVIDREKLSTTETWSTITGTWTLNENGQLITSAICWHDYVRSPYSIYIRNAQVLANVTPEDQVEGWDYILKYVGSDGAYYNKELSAIDFGAEYANKTIEFSMDVCGNAPAEGEALLGFVQSDMKWYQLVIDRSALSTTETWTTITGTWKLDGEGKLWTSAICWHDTDRHPYVIYIKNAKVLADITPSGSTEQPPAEYDYATTYHGNQGDVWAWTNASPDLTVNFGSKYANQTVTITLDVCGTALPEWTALLGFAQYNNGSKYWWSYEVAVEAISTTGKWTTITLTVQLDASGNWATSPMYKIGDGQSDTEIGYTIYMKNVEIVAGDTPGGDVEEEPVKDYDYKLEYISGGAYYNETLTAIDFGAEYANKTIEFSMEVCGTAPAEGTALLGFATSDLSWYQLVIDRSALSTTETWTTITSTWTLDGEGKMWTSAICWDDNDRPSYAIYIKNVELFEYDYMANYTNVENYWSSAYGDLVTIEFGSEYANKTVAVSMEVCGTASAELYKADGVTPIKIGLSSGGTWFSYEINRSAVSTLEWTQVTFTWTLDANGNYTTSAFSWYDDIGNAYEYRESYQIFIRNAKVFSDYALSYESGGAFYNETLTAIDFGAEYANRTIAFTMDVCGTAPAEGTALLGFLNSSKTWYQLVIEREKLSTTETWSTITGTWTLDGEGKMWTSAICWDDNNRHSYSIYIKNVEVFSDYATTYYGNQGDVWAWTNASPDLTVSFGSEYANQAVTITLDVCGTANPEWTTAMLGFAQYNNGSKYWWSYEVSVEAISTTSKWTTITLTVQLDANGNWVTSPMYKIGDGQSDTEIGYTIYMKNVKVVTE